MPFWQNEMAQNVPARDGHVYPFLLLQLTGKLQVFIFLQQYGCFVSKDILQAIR